MEKNEQTSETLFDELVLDTPAQRLKYIRTLLRLTRPYIHEKYELSADTLNAWESGRIKLTDKGLERCLKIYNKEGAFVSKSWILTGEGLMPKLSLSLSGYFDSAINGEESEGILNDEESIILSEIEFFKKTRPTATVMLVSRDDMLPLYSKGDYVGGHFRSGEDLKDCLGRDCIIETYEGERYFRRLSNLSSDGVCNLVSLNPNSEGNLEPVLFNVEIARAAPVVWVRRRVYN